MIDRQTVDRILDAANIVDVVSDFVTLKRAGANLKGLCPFHDDRTPSFMVSPSKNICKCFACGKGGTPVHFIMEHEQLTYPEALRYLAKKYHIEVQERELTDEEKLEQSERESLFVVNEWANEWFQRQMNETVDGRAVGLAYFRQRGFRDDIIKRFQLGFCPDKYDAQWQAAKAEGFNEDYILKTGLCIRNEAGRTYDRFRNRVIFPIHTLSGKVVGFGGRVLDSRTKGVNIKYQNSPENAIYSKRRELYGLFFAKKAIVREDLCYLVEGYTDVMAMHQMGVENVVASSGTALTNEQIRAIHRFTENIVVIYDGDAAGIKASQRGIDMLLAEGMSVRLLLLPDGDDPDSFARKHTATEYQSYLKEHQVDFIRFKTDLLLNEAQGDPIRLSRLVNNIVDSLAVIPDEITRTFYIKETSQMLALSESIITNAVAKQRQRMREERQRERERQRASAERPIPNPSLQGGGETGEQPTSQSPDSSAIHQGRDEAGVQQGHGEEASSEPAAVGSFPSQRDSDVDPLSLAGADVSKRPAAGASPSLVLQTEALLVQMIVRHGEKVMCELPDEQGGQRPLTVVEFVQYALAQDNLELRAPLHRQILDEALQHFREEGFRCARYFENHPDLPVAELATELAHDSETLSRIHEKGIPVKPEEERLMELLPHLIADYKLALVDDELKGLMQQMRDPVVLADKDAYINLIQRYQELKQVQGELGRLRGDRVFA
ncbi:MAG: DNA primase [Bacteroidaceae bacterium]|nr:DNA primase [Bacteroidaceae bacterium]